MALINVEGVGVINFDDGMTQDQIVEAIEKDILPKYGPKPQTNLVRDIPASFVAGVGSLAEGVGALAGLPFGAIDNPITQAGKWVEDTASSYKSEGLRAKEAEMARRLEAAKDQGLLEQTKEGAASLLGDPYLAGMTAVQTVPSLLGSAGSGLLAQLGARGAIKGAEIAAGKIAAEKLAKKVALQGSIIGGAALQTGDVVSDTYKDVMDMDLKVLEASPAYQDLRKSMTDQEAREVLATKAAREAALIAAPVSYGTARLLPGVEHAMFGKEAKAGLIARVLKGAAGEAVQEYIEEGSGRLGRNVGVADTADVERNLMQGVGTQAIQGGIMGGVMGGGTSAVAGRSGAKEANAPRGEDAELRGALRDYVGGQEQDFAQFDAAQLEQQRNDLVRQFFPTISSEQFDAAPSEVQDTLMSRAMRRAFDQETLTPDQLLNLNRNREILTKDEIVALIQEREQRAADARDADLSAEQSDFFRIRAEEIYQEARQRQDEERRLAAQQRTEELLSATRGTTVAPETSPAEKTVEAAQEERPQAESTFPSDVARWYIEDFATKRPGEAISVPALQVHVSGSTGQPISLAETKAILQRFTLAPSGKTGETVGGTPGFILQQTRDGRYVPVNPGGESVTRPAQPSDVRSIIADRLTRSTETDRPASQEFSAAQEQQSTEPDAAPETQQEPAAPMVTPEAYGRAQQIVQSRLAALEARGAQGKRLRGALTNLLSQRGVDDLALYKAFRAADVIATILPQNANHNVDFMREAIGVDDPEAFARSGGQEGQSPLGMRRRPEANIKRERILADIQQGMDPTEAYAAEVRRTTDGLIQLATDPVALTLMEQTAAHEGFHVLQDYYAKYDPEFARFLDRAFQDDMTVAQIDSSIRRKLQATRLPGESGKSYLDQLTAALGERKVSAREMQAYVFGALLDANRRGTPMTGLPAAVARFINFLRDFSAKFGNALRGDGFRTVETAMTRVAEGDARRFDGSAVPTDKDVGRSSGAQYAARSNPQTETPEFKRWFGKSQVVDASGQPLRVYHGTHKDISKFVLPGQATGRQTGGRALFFAETPQTANDFARWDGGNVVPAYLRAEKVFDFTKESDVQKIEGFIRSNFKTIFPGALYSPETAIKFLRGGDYGILENQKVLGWMKRNGYDGMKLMEREGQPTYAVFSPTQIKSAVGNRGTFDPADPRIAYSARPEYSTNIFGTTVKSKWGNLPESKMDDFLYVMQDKQIDLKRVIETIRSAVGNISDRWNAYLQEELYHGRTAKKTQDFLNDELKPLMEDMRQRGVSIPQFEEYLQNRHAEERNNQIARINPSMPDRGSGIATADARRYLANLTPQQRSDFQALARRVDAITRNTRRLLVSSGLETQDTIDQWERTYRNYVPLFREDADFGSSGPPGSGQGFSVSGPASRRATGSQRQVVDILANLAMQRERTIVRAEKARVAQALYGLAVQYPNTTFWRAIDPTGEKDVAKAQADLVAMGMNPTDAENIFKEPVHQMVDPRTGLVVSRVNPLMRGHENVIAVRFDGRERYVFFNTNDERAHRMVESLKNLDADQLGEVLSMAATVTRYFAAINTQFNPVFGAINLLRDAFGAVFNLSTTPIADRKAEVMANIRPALAGIYSDLRSRRKGNGPGTSPWAVLWEEFQREGGQTGYRDQFSSSAERAAALQRVLDPGSWADSRLGKVFTANGTLKVPLEAARKGFAAPLFGWLSDYNETAENAVRLSAYKAAKDKGLSNQQAASIAKNLTVNFNRKGQIATQAGALYAFFNASVQGNARLFETLRGPAGKKILAGGILLGAMQATLLASAGFDDDEPPDFVKERNIVIPTGDKKYITIPMPLGFHLLPNASRIMTELFMSGGKDAAKKAGQIIGSVFEAFNPLGSAGLSVQTIAPTIVDPLVALSENRDWTGKPIARTDRSDLAPTPGYTRAKETASWVSKGLSYFFNMASGGTDFKKGAFSPTPDQIGYLIGQVTGGVGREIMKIDQALTSAVTGEELPTYKTPLLGRFYGDAASGPAESGRFYENITKLNGHEAEIKGRMKTGQPVYEYLRENPEARLYEVANKIERDVQKLRKTRREMLERGVEKERIKQIEEVITTRMKLLNDRVRTLEKQGA